jgi:hypothetical protein
VKVCKIDGCDRKIHGQGLCSKHYHQFRVSGDWAPAGPKPDLDGLGVCECPTTLLGTGNRVSRKCCTRCGYPSVHRMAPHIRQLALTRQPQLAHQVIQPPPIQYEWSVSCR